MAKNVKEKVIYVKSDDALHARLVKASDITDRPMSQIAREAIVEKLQDIEKAHPELAAA